MNLTGLRCAIGEDYFCFEMRLRKSRTPSAAAAPPAAGAGRALLADAQAHGASSLECFAANAPARHFYDRQGWRVTQAYTRFFAGRDRSFVRYEYLEG